MNYITHMHIQCLEGYTKAILSKGVSHYGVSKKSYPVSHSENTMTILHEFLVILYFHVVVPHFKVTYHIKWVTTYWTDGTVWFGLSYLQ